VMQNHPPAIFLADVVGLDVLNSIASPAGTPIDWLADGDGLLRWLNEAKLVPSETLDEIKARAARSELDKIAGDARALREWFRSFVRKHMGRRLPAAALRELTPLNWRLQRDATYRRIVPHQDTHGDRLTFEATRHWRSPASLLSPVTEAMARFVCEEDFSDVKACEGAGCTLMFVDHTSGRARRWCSMATCGNRAKQAAHRNRRKAGSDRSTPLELSRSRI
jgi:predicted RNA-binding Zn ribbon-like protein